MASTVLAIVPGVTIAAAIAIGTAVAPPDPVAVEAIAGPAGIPRRLTTTLQSEGLFNDAVAIVVFTAAIAATQTGEHFGLNVLGDFVLGLFLAIVIGFAAATAGTWLSNRVADVAGCNAITLILPFAVYVLAEEVHASGVVAIVVVAVQMASHQGVDDVEDRLTGRAFWDVIELLVTGVAFGPVGIQLYHVFTETGPELGQMFGQSLAVCAVVIGVRVMWLMLLLVLHRRTRDPWVAPRTWQESLILTWGGMRGLATLALAIPSTGFDGPLEARAELLVISATVVFFTLIIPALTLPALVRLLSVQGAHETEQRAERNLIRRASKAAISHIHNRSKSGDLLEDTADWINQTLRQLELVVAGESPDEYSERVNKFYQRRKLAASLRAEALHVAREEIVRARNEPGIDPEVAVRVLRQLDLRSGR